MEKKICGKIIVIDKISGSQISFGLKEKLKHYKNYLLQLLKIQLL
jgi:hypothetical protein